MITTTHVRYTAKAEYAEQNKKNIRRVMDDLRALGRTDLRYTVFVEDDGKTFNHLPQFANEEARKAFGDLASFRTFQAELQESHPEVPPTVTNLTPVGSSYDLF